MRSRIAVVRSGSGATRELSAPYPTGVPLEIRARVKELKSRKVVMDATLSAEGQICARGEVVGVQMPEELTRPR
jgi:hypothetical protein